MLVLAYSEVKYVEPLIAENTVNTLPMNTLNAYREQGQPELRIDQSIAEADDVMIQLADLGVDIPAVTQALEEEGIKKFVEPYEAILNKLDQLRQAS